MKHSALATAVLLSLTLAVPAAHAQYAREIPLIDTNPQVPDMAQVDYVTGGIGDDERDSIEAMGGEYNLHVTSASRNGAFIEDTNVVISRKHGRQYDEVLNVTAGPLLYVRLPAGTYVLEASHGSDVKKQTITINRKSKTKTVRLAWNVDAMVSDEDRW